MARPKLNKAQKIRNYLAKGKSVAEIAKATGATASYIYVVKSRMESEHKQAEGIMALKDTTNSTVTISGGLTTINLPRFEFDEVPASAAPEVKPTLWQRVKKFFGG